MATLASNNSIGLQYRGREIRPTEMTLTQVHESLLELEINRLVDVYEDEVNDANTRQDAMKTVVTWFRQLGHDDRSFLETTALPLVAFRAFEDAMDRSDDSGGPLVVLLRRLGDADSAKEWTEVVFHSIAMEARAFVTVLGHEEASTDAMLRVIESFIDATSRHKECETLLCKILVEDVGTTTGKKAIVQQVERSEKLTPDQKISVFLGVRNTEPTANVREHAARCLLPFATHIRSVASLIPLLKDKSQKVRRVATGCIIEIGMDVLEEDLGEYSLAELIVSMADQVSGVTQEKRFTAFVRDYFAKGNDLDEVCELSIRLDEAGASTHPKLSKIVVQTMGTVLNSSYFQRSVYPNSQHSDLTFA